MTALTQALLVLLIQSTGLLLLGLLALRLTQKRGPAVQSLVGRASLVGVALLLLLTPLTGHVEPVIRVPEPTPPRSSATLPSLLAEPRQRAQREGEEIKMRPVGAPLAAPSDRRAGDVPVPTASVLPPDPGPAFQPAAPSKTPGSPGAGGQALALSGFLSVSAALLLWLAVCQRHLNRLRRAARAVTDGPALDLLAALTSSPPLLLTHPSVQSPFLAGYRRPAIFLPNTYAADFDADSLRAIFVHELAHRERRDNLWTLAARLLTALLWPQPLLWLLVRKLEHISEDSCDQAVLAASCPPRAYADCLLSLAAHPSRRREHALSAGVAPFRSSVGRRISRILATKGTHTMSHISLRLRLTIAAVTVAAATSSAFLVSSAPAQTQPKPSSVVGTWKLRTTVEDSSTTGKVPYQNMYTFNPDKTGLYRIDIGRYWGHPEFHAACPFTWSEAAGSITIKLPSSGADRVNEQQTGMIAPDGQTFLITKRQWQLKHWNGSSWQLSPLQTSFGVPHNIRRVTRSSFSLKGGQPPASGAVQTEVKSGELVVYAQGNVRIHGILNSGNTVLQASVAPDQQLNQAQFLAGLTPVQGPGVVVTLQDSKKTFPKGLPLGVSSPGLIHDTDINQVVNELKAAGAEAVAVNDQRLVATSAVRTAGQTIFINSTPQAAPYTIKAIGNPKTLAGALTLPGGIASMIKSFDPAMFFVQQAQTLTLPAYTGGSEPRYAKPVSQPANPVQLRLQALQAVRDQLAAWYNKDIDARPSRQIREDMRQKQERIVQIDAQIAVLNQIASSHQVY